MRPGFRVGRSLAAALVVVLACSDAATLAPQEGSDRLGAWIPDSSATILRTSTSQLDDPILAVVSTRPEWTTLWVQAWGNAQAAPPLPQVDFVLASVLVVALGKRAGPGYSVTIDSVVVHTSGAVLFATEIQAGANCTPPPGPTAPVHMVLAPGHPPVTDWQVGTTRRDCTP